MDDIVKWLRSPKPWHKYTPAEIADELERRQAGLAEADEQIAALQAKVHLCAAYDRIEKRLAEAERLLEHSAHRIAQHNQGKTHWEGCEKGHNDCAHIKEIRAFLADQPTGDRENV